jgi:chaperonin GroES
MVNNITPLYDKVLVQKLESNKTTTGGIILPDSKSSASKGQVIAVGIGKQSGTDILPMQVKEGDIVLFNSYAGTDVSSIVEQKNMLLIREEDILAIIK